MESYKWVFTAVPEEGYRWSYVDGNGRTLKSSDEQFSSLHECVADARVHGYTGNARGS
jgi:hypothetical protein